MATAHESHLTEVNRLVRELSHDMHANYMVLKDSFHQLQEQVQESPVPSLVENAAHVEACLKESKRLIDDLSILGSTGTIQMQPERVEVCQVINDVLYELRELLGGIKVSMQSKLVSPKVWCHEKRLKQIITNVVRNAALHGCDVVHPQIIITVSSFVVQPPGDVATAPTVRLEFYDNGPGIPQHAAREIFKLGKRLPGTKASGTGTGLAIVQRIAEYYRGRASIDTACRNGTKLVVELPGVEQSS